MKQKLILIAGPTASGKTKSSVQLAKRINGEIISCDSMQVYTGMDIGTAKVTQEEMGGIPHYMIDLLDPREGCNIAWFKTEVEKAIHAISEKGKIPILVGGTGFYLNAILFDTQFDETEEDTTYRKELEALADLHGTTFLHNQLGEVDPVSANTIHPNNVKRVIRALEYYAQTGHPISSHNEEEKEKRAAQVSPYTYQFFALDMDRTTLYNRINLRIDQMLTEGLVEEVQSFYNAGLREDLTSMKAIGYKEFFPYFRGEMSLEACVDKLKQNTRNFAKRQLTWFRHQANPLFIPVDQLNFDATSIVDKMLQQLQNIVD
ncbi:MAG: tRNA (adenosine(37)-N6)-dimethylallyltransferase MiaA [Niameybacter sp.]|uniref:tRNA (adenosine(37)-N6)-dimethylallyltransferase MiaA n=1 Tax=Niameybacter sp. TaxID=2033640 RepID=UPI002FC9404A